MIVDDHISTFNKNLACNYHPSDFICLDKYMSRWYGIVGHWINYGLPQYIEIDRKSENGCEIHNDSDGVSGIIIQLNLVNNYFEEDLHSP